MSIDKKLVMGKELIGVKRRRNQTHIYQKIEPELQEKRESDDWEVDSILKTRVKMKKLKPLDEQFEDEVWLLFASMGFECMNRDRHLDFPYSTNNDKLTKQIDVFAVDEETIIFVECKCANNGKKGNFKEDLEAIRGFREGLFNIAKKNSQIEKQNIYLLPKITRYQKQIWPECWILEYSTLMNTQLNIFLN